uniref:Transmembrane protein 120B n=1 Tax=Callithrix jacchus TaxID=9483 RepID=A0A8I4A611_CALJA
RKRKRRVGRALPHPDRKSLKTVSESHGGRGVSAVLKVFGKPRWADHLSPGVRDQHGQHRQIGSRNFSLHLRFELGQEVWSGLVPAKYRDTLSLCLAADAPTPGAHQKRVCGWMPGLVNGCQGKKMILVKKKALLVQPKKKKKKKPEARLLPRVWTRGARSCLQIRSRTLRECFRKFRNQIQDKFFETESVAQAAVQYSQRPHHRRLCALL